MSSPTKTASLSYRTLRAPHKTASEPRMKKPPAKKTVKTQSPGDLTGTLKTRFEQNSNRHKGLVWAQVEAKLAANPQKLKSLGEMERTGGEPDVVGYDKATGEFIFCDCSAESPAGRRSLCYDREALDSRKEAKP